MLRIRVLHALLVLSLLAPAIPVRAQDDETIKFQGLSDRFFKDVDAGNLPPKPEWEAERPRLKTLAATLSKTVSIRHSEIWRRQAVVELYFSQPNGSEEAHALFTKAKEALRSLDAAGKRPADFKDQMAIIQSYLADNLLMLEKEPETVEAFREAIKLVMDSSYRGTFPELKVRVRSADLAFMRQRYEEILEVVPPGLAIYKKLVEAKVEVDPEVVRNMIWYLAIAKSERGQDAIADFDLFLTTYAGKINAHDLAEAHRQKAINLARQAPKEDGAPRTEALRKALAAAETAKASIPNPKEKNDKLERYHVIIDVGMLQWRLLEREKALAEFTEALAVGEDAEGKDSPVLLQALTRLRDVNQALKNQAEVDKYQARITEIEKKAKKEASKKV
jgi:tetratricopeptide (TPR) repeat protein